MSIINKAQRLALSSLLSVCCMFPISSFSKSFAYFNIDNETCGWVAVIPTFHNTQSCIEPSLYSIPYTWGWQPADPNNPQNQPSKRTGLVVFNSDPSCVDSKSPAQQELTILGDDVEDRINLLVSHTVGTNTTTIEKIGTNKSSIDCFAAPQEVGYHYEGGNDVYRFGTCIIRSKSGKIPGKSCLTG